MTEDMPDFKDLLNQARGLHDKIQKVQAEAASKTVTAESGAGMVKVTANLKGEVLSIKIDKNLFEPDDFSMLEDLVRAAVNEAMRLARDGMQKEVTQAAGGMVLPNMKLF